jgi:hypothetical protein
MTNTNDRNKNMMDKYFIRIAVNILFVRNFKGLYLYVITMRTINPKIDITSIIVEDIFVLVVVLFSLSMLIIYMLILKNIYKNSNYIKLH